MEPTAEHEALCTRCGTSCHYAVPVNGLPVVVDDLHCRFLERDGHADGAARFRCSVYERRFEAAPWCATVDEALREGYLGQTCGYVAAARARGETPARGKTRLHPRLEARVLPAIRDHLLEEGAPLGVSADGLRRFMARVGEPDVDVVIAGERWRVIRRERSDEPPTP